MFYHIEGKVAEIGQNLLVIDCGGVGYAVSASLNTVAGVKMGERAKLYIAESISENNFDLYGFATKSEKRCYEMLVSVSGIGPKAAISILSYSTPEGLALAIMNNDEKALTIAPGIGKKIAQRVILELKDKMNKEMGSSISQLPTAVTQQAANSTVGDALAALAVLGYSNAEVAPAMNSLAVDSMTAEQIIKAVLKQMVK